MTRETAKGFGYPEISKLALGDHLCRIYRDAAEQMKIIVPYLMIGLDNHEKCIYIIEESTQHDVLQAFRQAGLDLDKYIVSGQFVFLTKDDAYLKGGSFDPVRMIATLKEAEKNALAEGYAGLRVTGEMTWVFTRLPGVEKLIEYEAKLNFFFPASKSTAICQYHESRFDPGVMIDVIHTHPIVVIYGEICDNPYYIPPDEFLLRLKSFKIPIAIYERVREDILQRARLLREHRATIEELRLDSEIFKNVAEGIFLVGLDDGVIKWANERMEKMFGYERGEMIGKDVGVVNAPSNKTPEEIKAEIIGTLNKTGEWHGEAHNLKKDGAPFWCYANVSVFAHPKYGRVVVAVHTDITDGKLAELELKSKVEQLEKFNKLSVDRELKMIELKERINELEAAWRRT